MSGRRLGIASPSMQRVPLAFVLDFRDLGFGDDGGLWAVVAAAQDDVDAGFFRCGASLGFLGIEGPCRGSAAVAPDRAEAPPEAGPPGAKPPSRQQST